MRENLERISGQEINAIISNGTGTDNQVQGTLLIEPVTNHPGLKPTGEIGYIISQTGEVTPIPLEYVSLAITSQIGPSKIVVDAYHQRKE